METGIELIAKERQKQIEVKGYDKEFIEDHPEYYSMGQLADAAVYCIYADDKYEPADWPKEDVNKLYYKEAGIQSLIIAGALIAAEIDRLQAEETNS